MSTSHLFETAINISSSKLKKVRGQIMNAQQTTNTANFLSLRKKFREQLVCDPMPERVPSEVPIGDWSCAMHNGYFIYKLHCYSFVNATPQTSCDVSLHSQAHVVCGFPVGVCYNQLNNHLLFTST